MLTSVCIPNAQSVPSPINIVLSTHLSVSYASPFCCVSGLGSMVPVSNSVMETWLIFNLFSYRNTDRQKVKDIQAEAF